MLSEQRAMCFHSWWFCWSSAWPRPSHALPSDRRPAHSSPPQQPRPKRGALSSAIPTSWWSTKWRWQPTGRERCSPNNIRNGDLPLNGPKSSVSANNSFRYFLWMSSSFRPWTSCKPKENIAHTQTISPCIICESSTAFSFSSLALFFIFEIFALAFLARVCVIRAYVIFFFINQIRIFVEYSSLYYWIAQLQSYIQGRFHSRTPSMYHTTYIRFRSGKLIKRG